MNNTIIHNFIITSHKSPTIAGRLTADIRKLSKKSKIKTIINIGPNYSQNDQNPTKM